MNIKAFDQPFRHWIIRGLDLPGMSSAVPPASDVCWVRYENDCEMHKRTCENLTALASSWRSLFQAIDDLDADLEEMTGIRPLKSDPYGGGLHVTDPGGWLQPHLDYNIHPRTGLERRVNFVLFLNREWRKSWGGAFELYDDAGRKLVKRIFLEFGEAVVWEGGDTAFHGTQPVSFHAQPRITAAAYYFSAPRPGTTPRKRALFVPCRWREEQRKADWEPPPNFQGE